MHMLMARCDVTVQSSSLESSLQHGGLFIHSAVARATRQRDTLQGGMFVAETPPPPSAGGTAEGPPPQIPVWPLFRATALLAPSYQRPDLDLWKSGLLFAGRAAPRAPAACCD
ncbi:hypothetical protein AAFF_G00300820 [Aldrovandia affinis]|uniref:Uncharacterized protein n=1 Tax=Aldrovandia affinis TaxID=143900 RepID=A0AAD7SQ13_9TELE|nr:hypothetical protein AAFF_G00300820 [Aldrovandia affinis]